MTVLYFSFVPVLRNIVEYSRFYFTNLAFNTFIRDTKQAFGTNIRKKMYTAVERIMKVCIVTLCQYESGNVL